MQYSTLAAVFVFALHHGCHALRAKSRVDPDAIDTYSFVQFLREYGRSYATGSAEYSHRLALFEKSCVGVQARNAQNKMEGKSWRAGVHPFMDWSPAERKVLNGYKPAASRHSLHRGVSLLHEHAQGGSHSLSNQTALSMGGMSVESGPVLRNQGNCGSCWAISAVEAVEAQLLRSGVTSTPRLSAQAVVDCVPNPEHCGGTGGCDGATGELAYGFMRDYGIPVEEDLAYTATTQTCPQQLNGPWPSARRARVDGWNSLPSNRADPLMQALTNDGPVVVAVDGNDWFDSDSGVFDSCKKDAILGHAVLAKGYGTDGGNRYWLILNSWGSGWGEQGHIRLKMHEDEEQWCGIDSKPKEGVGCDGGPPQVTVCGACGILYDPLIPTGVRLEGGDQAVANPVQFSSDPFMPGASSPINSDIASLRTPPASAPDAAGQSQASAPDAAGQSPEQQMDALLRQYQTH